MQETLAGRYENEKPLNHTKGIVEKMILDNKEFDSKSHLYKKLPTGMQYRIF